MLYQETANRALSDLLQCEESELDKLEEVYSDLAKEVFFEPEDEISKGSLDEILYSLYNLVSISVKDRIEDMLEEYQDTLNPDGSISSDTEFCSLITECGKIFLSFDLPHNGVVQPTAEQIATIKEHLTKFEVIPITSAYGIRFGNDLDFIDFVFDSKLDYLSSTLIMKWIGENNDNEN